MSMLRIVRCDGPECDRQIHEDVHEGTWLTMYYGDLWKPEKERSIVRHFCSFYCSEQWTQQFLNRTGL